MIPRPVTSSLPATIDPILLAEQGTQLSGRLVIRNMARLGELVTDNVAEAEINLVFETAGGSRIRRMYGHIVAEVSCLCQRCLEPMAVTLTAHPEVILQREGETSR